MAKTYSGTDVQNSEENVAKKTDGRAIPMAGVALFVLLALALTLFSLFRNRQAPASSPDAVQNAPIAVPAGRDSGG